MVLVTVTLTRQMVVAHWVILYAKLAITPAREETCGIKIIRIMCPTRPHLGPFNPAYDYCLPIGQISCAGLAGVAVSTPYPINSTPTPVPTPTSSCSGNVWTGVLVDHHVTAKIIQTVIIHNLI